MKKVAGGVLVVALGVGAVWFVLQRDSDGQPGRPTPGANASPEAASAGARALFQAPAPVARGAASLKGRVLGPSGPVAGATVIALEDDGTDVASARTCECGFQCGRKLLECGCGEAGQQIVDLVARREGEPELLARTTTGGDGSFELTGLPARTLALWADHPATGMAVKAGVHLTDEVELTLEPGVALTGAVTGDDKQTPVPGALVSAILVRSSRFFEVVAGEDGGFRLGPVPAGQYVIVASKSGWLPAHQKVMPDGTHDLSLRLDSPRAVAGHVEHDGKPVEGAEVHLEGAHKKLDVRTSAGGAFRFESLRPSPYEVRATHALGVGSVRVQVAPKEDVTDVVITLGPSGVLEGDVVDERNSPLPGALVSAWSERQNLSAQSDTAGHFSIGHVAPGAWRLSASLKGYLMPAGDAREVRLEVKEGGVAQGRLTLEKGAVIAGKVVDPSGRPIARVGLLLDHEALWPGGVRVAKPPRISFGEVMSADDGTFVLDGIEPGDWPFTATHEAWITAHERLRAPSTGVVITMKAGNALKGVVRESGGTPVANAAVMVIPDVPPELENPDDSKRATTKADGSFLVEGVTPGKYVVVASARDPEGPRAASLKTEVRPGIAPVEVVFPMGLEVSGVVVDAAGKPVSGARVTAMPVEQGPMKRNVDIAEMVTRAGRASTSDVEGRFTLKHLGAGKVRLNAWTEGRPLSVEAVEVEAGAKDVVLKLARATMIRGRVLSPQHTPVTEFLINGRKERNAQGKFEVPLEDEYPQLTVWANGFAPATRKVEPAGHDEDVGDVVLTKGRRVDVLVVDAAGAPVEKARLDSPGTGAAAADGLRRGVDVWAATSTGADGRLSLSAEDEGPFTIEVFHPDYLPATVEVPAGKSSVRVALSRAEVLDGRVVDKAGKPVEGVQVVLVSTEDVEAYPLTGGPSAADGSFRVTGVTPGVWRASVDSRDPRPRIKVWPKQVTIEAGKPAFLELVGLGGEGTLKLTVVDEKDEEVMAQLVLVRGTVPLPATVDAWRAAATLGLRASGVRGTPEFSGLDPGHFTVLVMVPSRAGGGVGIHRAEADVVRGEQALRIVLPRNLPQLSFPRPKGH